MARQRNLGEILDTMPGEIVNMIAGMVAETPWPESVIKPEPGFDNEDESDGDTGDFAWTPPPLHVGLINSQNSNLATAMKLGLSKQIFVRFSAYRCEEHSNPDVVTEEVPFLLPRVMSVDGFETLRNQRSIRMSTVHIKLSLCDCRDAPQVCNTVFVLDRLTSLLFVITMRSLFLCYWRRIVVDCHIFSAWAAPLIRDFVQFMFAVMPAFDAVPGPDAAVVPLSLQFPGAANWTIPLGPLIRHPGMMGVLRRLQFQIDTMEDLADQSLYVHQIWPSVMNEVVQGAFDACLPCALTAHERDRGTDRPLKRKLDWILQMRLQACILCFRGVLDALDRHDSIRLPTGTGFMYRPPENWQYDKQDEHKDPHATAPNDLAMAMWIVQEFGANLERIPAFQDDLLDLLNIAVQNQTLVLIALAKSCLTSVRVPTIGQLFWQDLDGDEILDREYPLESGPLIECARQCVTWSHHNAHILPQTDEVYAWWARKIRHAFDQYDLCKAHADMQRST